MLPLLRTAARTARLPLNPLLTVQSLNTNFLSPRTFSTETVVAESTSTAVEPTQLEVNHPPSHLLDPDSQYMKSMELLRADAYDNSPYEIGKIEG
jgi:hypothetical protein